MSSSPERELPSAFDRKDLSSVHCRVAEISVSVTAPRSIVTITVGQHGQIVDLRFPSGTYRSMSPSELAATVLQTLRQAQAQAREEVATLIAPHFDLIHSQAEPDGSGIFRKLSY